MRGNSHGQFLGGWARATAPGYPATLDHLTSATTASGRDVDSIAAITGRREMRLYVGERNTARSPTYASISPLPSVKGSLRQASPALDPAIRSSKEMRKKLIDDL